jgi:uncharacterized protein involved in exopolysaccharide biosynthesis
MDKLANPLAGTSPEQEQEIDLRQYWRIVSRYKWGILGLAIAITGTGDAYSVFHGPSLPFDGDVAD